MLDCIVIGAGASGLACARQLIDQGLNVVIIEGRSRVGGRAHTLHDASLDVPVELGAEFIHGAPKVTLDRAQSAGLSFYDVADEHLERKAGALKQVDFWEKMQEVMAKLDSERKTDRSVREFLNHQRSLDDKTRALTEAFVEGFHAADLDSIGERGLAISEQTEDNGLNGVNSFRLVGGYDKLMATFLHGTTTADDATPLRLNTVAKKIEWKDGRATVHLKSTAGFELKPLSARTVVVTIPLGVLKAPRASHAAIEFDPQPEGLDHALTGVHMGHAIRITFRFRTRFWEDISKDPVVFLHAGPEHPFPTWWTFAPMRAPVFIAWQGGPKAEALARLSEQERVSAALDTFAFLLDKDLSEVQSQLESWFVHDWTNDPFSLGAYSYVGIDGDKKAKMLSLPVANTLFFAGEATHMSATRGTVDGAIETGLRAADQVLKTFKT